MPTNGLIVIVPVKPGCEERLHTTLNRIGNDVNGRRLTLGVREPHIDFPRSTTIHFARLALLADPDRGAKRQRLLLATDYDGPWQKHVAELIALTTEPEAIWGCCIGYAGPERFAAFIRKYTVEPQTYYMAFRGLTLPRIRRVLQSRAQAPTPAYEPSPTSLTASLSAVAGDLLRFPWAGLDLPVLLLQRGPLHALMAARRINATVDRVWWVRLFNRLTLNSYTPPTIRYSSAPVDTEAGYTPATAEDEVATQASWDGTPREDLVSQNQLTLITVVQPDQVDQLQAVLAVIELYARRLTTPGSLVGISTIHTVRWALLDGGKRLLLVSNYDGTWENYIDEFAELILSGLDAIWGSSYGFPPLGAQDVAALKHFLRAHQAPANLFYSAYPTATVLNIADALKLEHAWPTLTAQSKV